MFEAFILGSIQGITEWLPVSSEGVLVLVKSNFFSSDVGLEELIRQSFFLHLGTFFAALLYFRKEVIRIIHSLFTYQKAKVEDQKLIQFLLVSTLISGVLGMLLLHFIGEIDSHIDMRSQLINLFVGALLLITAFMQLRAPARGHKNVSNLTLKDAGILGLTQGLSALPGFSRSGLTVSMLLLRNYDKEAALRLSFLMSLPVVLGANIILNAEEMLLISGSSLVGILSSFIFGIITIGLLIKLARNINFGLFVLFFGFLTILSAFL
ncbi:MAG: undecaprenyl-diphosphate phosphatase [Candidatus Paceibacterota bacterium]